MAIQEILFRKTSAIPSPSFGVFSLYKYPAKFIPQVPAFVMENYAKKGMKVFDPFAGFGTVGYTARLYGLDYILWDLNPLLGHLHSLCEIKPKPLDKNLIAEIKAHPQEFIPKWPNLSYWHPEEFFICVLLFHFVDGKVRDRLTVVRERKRHDRFPICYDTPFSLCER
jgi:hypothetical protein